MGDKIKRFLKDKHVAQNKINYMSQLKRQMSSTQVIVMVTHTNQTRTKFRHLIKIFRAAFRRLMLLLLTQIH